MGFCSAVTLEEVTAPSTSSAIMARPMEITADLGLDRSGLAARTAGQKAATAATRTAAEYDVFRRTRMCSPSAGSRRARAASQDRRSPVAATGHEGGSLSEGVGRQ